METNDQTAKVTVANSPANRFFNYAIYFSRIFVGALFIVSGMVKANDPLGFSYKLEEYFSEAALGWTFFEPYSLLLGILVSCGEIILGFAILFGGKPKLTIWLLLILTVFFGFLTYYTAKCDPKATYKVKEMVSIQVDANGKEVTPEEIAADTVPRKLTEKKVEREVEHPVQCVTDCGCFGDAMKGTIGRSLTPWESFSKDMVLLFFVIILFIGQNRIKLNTHEQDKVVLRDSTIMLLLIAGYFFHWLFPVVFSIFGFAAYSAVKRWHLRHLGKEWSIAIIISLMSFGFAWYCYNYLPVKDFTPYAVGKSIPNGMKSAEELGLRPPLYATPYLMKNKKTGKEVTILSDEYLNDKKWQNEQEWTFVKALDEKITVHSGYEPPIPAFNFYYESDSGQVDLTADIVENPSQSVLVLVMYNLEKANTGKMEEINALYTEAVKNGYLFYCATSSSLEDCKKFSDKYGCKFPFVTGDEQGILKPMVRSNPGLLLLNKGMIDGKWHNNSLPSFEEIKNLNK